MAYVYKHIRKDTDNVFYIGMSSLDDESYYRANCVYSRNPYWKEIVKKHGFYVEIVKENLTVDEAFDLEMFLISKYGRKDINTGILSNMSDGGEGNTNYKPTKENRIKHSERMKEKGNPFYGRSHKKSTKKIISEKAKLRFKDKTNHPLWGRVYSEEERDIFRGKRDNIKGGLNPNSKKVINTYTKEVFDTIIDAAKSIKVSNTNLGKWLKNRKNNPTNFLYLHEYTGEIFYPSRKMRDYKIRKISTNEVFGDMTSFKKHINLCRSTILKKFKNKEFEDYEIIIKSNL